jgi:2-hydroxy-3-oxopropionate reductase
VAYLPPTRGTRQCPVSGGVEGAEAGTLSIMVGGEERDVADAWAVLSACGDPVHLGPLGSGQVAKACNQMIVASKMLAPGEAAVLAERSGLDLAELFRLLGGGYAGSRILESRGDRIIQEDYSPSGVAK